MLASFQRRMVVLKLGQKWQLEPHLKNEGVQPELSVAGFAHELSLLEKSAKVERDLSVKVWLDIGWSNLSWHEPKPLDQGLKKWTRLQLKPGRIWIGAHFSPSKMLTILEKMKTSVVFRGWLSKRDVQRVGCGGWEVLNWDTVVGK